MPAPALNAALAALAALAAAGPAGPAAAHPAAPPALLRALSETPAGGPRAAAATRPLLGAPYLHSPLGEGEGPDPDPRFRLDAFDCMTFVETAIALGSSADLAQAARALDEIRYAGAPARAARLHEVQAQWIPANLARGWIAELVPALAGPRALRLAKEHTPESWAAVRRAGRAVEGLPRGREPLGRFETWALAPADLAAVADRIPEGAVLFVLREDQPARPSRVSHAGLLVRGPGGEPRVRHATSTAGVARVIEEPLARFLVREARAFPAWPVAGYAVYAVPARQVPAPAGG